MALASLASSPVTSMYVLAHEAKAFCIALSALQTKLHQAELCFPLLQQQQARLLQ